MYKPHRRWFRWNPDILGGPWEAVHRTTEAGAHGIRTEGFKSDYFGKGGGFGPGIEPAGVFVSRHAGEDFLVETESHGRNRKPFARVFRVRIPKGKIWHTSFDELQAKMKAVAGDFLKERYGLNEEQARALVNWDYAKQDELGVPHSVGREWGAEGKTNPKYFQSYFAKRLVDEGYVAVEWEDQTYHKLKQTLVLEPRKLEIIEEVTREPDPKRIYALREYEGGNAPLGFFVTDLADNGFLPYEELHDKWSSSWGGGEYTREVLKTLRGADTYERVPLALLLRHPRIQEIFRRKGYDGVSYTEFGPQGKVIVTKFVGKRANNPARRRLWNPDIMGGPWEAVHRTTEAGAHGIRTTGFKAEYYGKGGGLGIGLEPLGTFVSRHAGEDFYKEAEGYGYSTPPFGRVFKVKIPKGKILQTTHDELQARAQRYGIDFLKGRLAISEEAALGAFKSDYGLLKAAGYDTDKASILIRKWQDWSSSFASASEGLTFQRYFARRLMDEGYVAVEWEDATHHKLQQTLVLDPGRMQITEEVTKEPSAGRVLDLTSLGSSVSLYELVNNGLHAKKVLSYDDISGGKWHPGWGGIWDKLMKVVGVGWSSDRVAMMRWLRQQEVLQAIRKAGYDGIRFIERGPQGEVPVVKFIGERES